MITFQMYQYGRQTNSNQKAICANDLNHFSKNKLIWWFNLIVPGTNTIDACSGITHGDNKRKKSATLLWIPPEKGSGGISFM